MQWKKRDAIMVRRVGEFGEKNTKIAGGWRVCFVATNPKMTKDEVPALRLCTRRRQFVGRQFRRLRNGRWFVHR